MSQKDYEFWAAEIANIDNIKERKKLALWFAEIFARNSSKFKPHLFFKAAHVEV